VLTHPAQRAILAGSGIDLAAKRIVERPVGALGAFTLRGRMAEEFTVGWIGRPVVHGGSDVKRVAWFVDAVRAAGGPLRALLLGERLEAAHTALRRRGVDCRYLRKSVYPIERFPYIYQGLDCVVISSSVEAGPLSLFEALASGVPVVSTPVGWAVELIRDGENGLLVETVEQMAAALRRVRAERAAWFERRAAIRASLAGHTLEGWVEANVELALQLVGAERERAADTGDAGLRCAAG
jgi:glycosyltransferase involved in cell wall biosynthesis